MDRHGPYHGGARSSTKASLRNARHLSDSEAHHSQPVADQTGNECFEKKAMWCIADDQAPDARNLHHGQRYSAEPSSHNSSRRLWRMVISVIVVAFGLLTVCFVLFRPHPVEDWEFELETMRDVIETSGVATDGTADDFVRLKTLDPDLLPGGHRDPEGKRRLVFVGDVHGCKDELTALLKKVDYSHTRDHLILTGDTISKGPDNVGVLDELIRLGATSVRGNHEDRILAMANSADEPLNADMSSHKAAKDAALLRRLKPRHLEYLQGMPLMLHIPALPAARQSTGRKSSPISEHILVAHAGIVPGVPLALQNPYFVMNMRSMHPKTHVPSARPAARDGRARPWIDVWGWYNDRLYRSSATTGARSYNELIPGVDDVSDSWLAKTWNYLFRADRRRPKPQVIIYGHDSHAGLQVKRWSKGLDTACVAGGSLSALVLEADGRYEIRSVKCQDHRT